MIAAFGTKRHDIYNFFLMFYNGFCLSCYPSLLLRQHEVNFQYRKRMNRVYFIVRASSLFRLLVGVFFGIAASSQ